MRYVPITLDEYIAFETVDFYFILIKQFYDIKSFLFSLDYIILFMYSKWPV